MINTTNFERQHTEIKDLCLKINNHINTKDITVSLDDLVKDINMLAGKLNMHMSTEDRFLYPEILKSKNDQLKEVAKQYIEEMGTIHIDFKNYKSNFNTKIKILNDKDGFLKETKNIIKLLENRIYKEELYLYPKVQLI